IYHTPYTIYHIPYTIYHIPYTIYHIPYTIHHIPFTVHQVERTSRVLDGSVLVVDAVAGVQAQTKTVWRSIRKHSLPCVGFVNKMDRAGASWTQSLKSIQEQLCTPTVCLHYPLLSSDGNGLGDAHVCGDGTLNKVVDLVGWKILEWAPPGQKGLPSAITTHAIETSEGVYDKTHIPSDMVYEKILQARRHMIDTLADYDDDLMGMVMEHDYQHIPIHAIIQSLRHGTIRKHFMPVVLGSALKGRGIQPLLDMMVGLLPSPLERLTHVYLQDKRAGQQLPLPDHLFCALAFKVFNHPQRGTMVYVRVYSGSAYGKMSIFNSTVQKEERVLQILSIQADDLHMVDMASQGEVVCLVGCKHTKTGDTLISLHPSPASHTNTPLHTPSQTSPLRPTHTPSPLPLSTYKTYTLEGLDIPPPVYSIALEPEEERMRGPLEKILSSLSLEDPSLQVEVSSETGQIVVKGLGELHLEVLVETIRQTYKLPVYVTSTYIQYLERLKEEGKGVDPYPCTFTYTHDVVREGKRHRASVTIVVMRREDILPCALKVSEELRNILSAEGLNVVTDALGNSVLRGGRGHPLVGGEF
ncbi:hypothetical protein EON63_20395, partial [archaeon]